MHREASIDRLNALTPAAGLYTTYVPLDKISGQIRRAVLEGDVHRLDRLWQLLQDRYPRKNLDECLVHPDPYTKDTNLVVATQRKLIAIVQWLLDEGVEDGGMTKTENGDTILHIAARVDCPEIINLYHARFAEVYDDDESQSYLVDWTNAKGESSLCIASQRNAEESLVTLLQLGASVKLHDNEGNTALHHASAYGNVESIRLLLQWNANAFVKNNMGYTASDYAYSFQVEQEIQNTVRSVLEAEKRARKLRGQPAALRPPSALADDSFDSEGDSIATQQPMSARQAAPPSPLPNSLKPLKLAAVLIPPPTPGPASSATSAVPQTPIFNRSTSPPTAQTPDNEHGRALQRIYARDQNAQNGFQTSSAFRGLVGPASSVSLASSSTTAVSMRRERSTSTEMTYATSSSSSAFSPTSSPHLGATRLPRMDHPLPPPPESPLPPLPTFESRKSSTSAFVSRLKRSGSSGTPVPTSAAGILEPALELQKSPPKTGFGRSGRLKQHSSLADLRSSVREAAGSTSPSTVKASPPLLIYTPALHKSGFHFSSGISRARSGT